MTPALTDEIVIIDLLALLLSVVTAEILWELAKKAFPAEVGDIQFFLTFICLLFHLSCSSASGQPS